MHNETLAGTYRIMKDLVGHDLSLQRIARAGSSWRAKVTCGLTFTSHRHDGTDGARRLLSAHHPAAWLSRHAQAESVRESGNTTVDISMHNDVAA